MVLSARIAEISKLEDERENLREKSVDHENQLSLALDVIYYADAFDRIKRRVKKLMERCSKLEADKMALTESVALGESNLTKVKREMTEAQKILNVALEELAT